MNWRAVSREALLLGLAGAGPALLMLQHEHPSWGWIGLAISAVGYLSARLMPSPPQEKTIALQKAELDSLRPPKPENDP